VAQIPKKYLMLYSNCAICGEPLIYRKRLATEKCYHCGIDVRTNTVCTNGHFVCDECTRRDVYDMIVCECLNYDGLNPVELADKIMSSNIVKTHGPEHHLIVPAVMLSVYLNYKKQSELKKEMLEDAKTRALKIHDGICATHGACGGAIGVGLFFSIILEVNELDIENYSYINNATASTLVNVAKYGGPRCCKRSSYFGILQIRNHLADDFGIKIPVPDFIKCPFVAKNKECTRENCLFY